MTAKHILLTHDQLKSADKWWEKHVETCKPGWIEALDRGKAPPLMAMAGFYYKYRPGSAIDGMSIGCDKCQEEHDITDYDSF